VNSQITGYDYHNGRLADFEGSKSTISTLVGGGTISPQPGGDTGGLTTTESFTRTGDTEVSVVPIASGFGWGTQKTLFEVELEAMLTDGNDGQNKGGYGGGAMAQEVAAAIQLMAATAEAVGRGHGG